MLIFTVRRYSLTQTRARPWSSCWAGHTTLRPSLDLTASLLATILRLCVNPTLSAARMMPRYVYPFLIERNTLYHKANDMDNKGGLISIGCILI